MSAPSSSESSRIGVVDALRGFTILSIMLLHNIEHFDLYHFPDFLPVWMKQSDSIIWDTLFFLFGGKSYAIFALLFGLTFFIQFSNQEKKGKDFGGRFAWRLIILFLFGIVNTLFYSGDILVLYAVLGFFLIPVRKWSDTVVLTIAAVLMFQPLEWYRIIMLSIDHAYTVPANLSNQYFAASGGYLTGNSFTAMLSGNLFNGRFASLFWSWENGRFFQTVSLFMTGMVLGRNGRFIPSDENKKFWKNILILSAVSFIPLYIMKLNIQSLFPGESGQRLGMIISSWSNISFMTLIISSFITAYHRGTAWLTLFSPLGRMSLTNYVMQSIIGSFIYYGYGLGMYRYTGATYSLVIGTVLCLLQIFFCRWWIARFKQGPLEQLWHKATWI
ncbi:MAG: DUF418 domain-containing protein [Bacteroidota bacterium]